MLKVINVAGARPNFMKVAPIVAAMKRRSAEFQPILVHTGQHYDAGMSDAFFRDLEMPEPDVHLGVGSGSHAAQTAAIMQAFEPVVETEKPDWVIVVGDVRDADHQDAHPPDSLLANLDRAKRSTVRKDLDLDNRNYAVLTLHRPSNVDEKISFGRILSALEEIARLVPIVFPAHPRTRKMIEELGLAERVERIKGLLVVDPVGYLDFLQLLSNACLVLTDSGGIQEETTVLGVHCITLRENTERPITVDMGTNTIAGTDATRIITAANRALDNPRNKSTLRIPPLWDGRTADRILDALVGKS